MSDSYVQVPTDSTGKKLQTFENVIGLNTVESEAVTLVRSSDNTEIGTSSQPVRTDPTGTTTQPVSAASLPLPTGASTAAKQPALGTAGTASADVITIQGIASMTAVKVDGSGVTQPVSVSALPLPTGASTAAKQPALGTAGTASADVITVQGIASMTALKVDGSAVTQPVSGTVTVQQSTASSLKVDLSGTAANATAIKVDNSAVTQPVSGTITANAGSGTFTTQTSATLAVTPARTSSNPASSGDNTIVAAQGVGKVIYVYSYSLSFSGTVNAKFTDGAAGTQLAFHYGIANSGGGEAVEPPGYLFKTTANTALILNLSGATAVACNVSYFVI